jgi:GR25 family glycosyltransferase involved in LPS biosynthesis
MILFIILILILIFFFRKSISKFTNNVVDVVYYINLDHRKDRRNLFLTEMKKLNLSPDKIIRIPAVYLKDQGHLGCSLSHIKALEQFIQSGKNTCIIFEDDFEFTVQDPMSYLQKLNKIDYDVVMLASNEISTTKYNDFLKKVNMATTASGYLVTKQFAPMLLQNFKEGAVLLEKTYQSGAYKGEYAVDQYWFNLQQQNKFYVFTPKLGQQRDSYSDIQQGNVSYKV